MEDQQQEEGEDVLEQKADNGDADEDEKEEVKEEKEKESVQSGEGDGEEDHLPLSMVVKASAALSLEKPRLHTPAACEEDESPTSTGSSHSSLELSHSDPTAKQEGETTVKPSAKTPSKTKQSSPRGDGLGQPGEACSEDRLDRSPAVAQPGKQQPSKSVQTDLTPRPTRDQPQMPVLPPNILLQLRFSNMAQPLVPITTDDNWQGQHHFLNVVDIHEDHIGDAEVVDIKADHADDVGKRENTVKLRDLFPLPGLLQAECCCVFLTEKLASFSHRKLFRQKCKSWRPCKNSCYFEDFLCLGFLFCFHRFACNRYTRKANI